MRFCNGISPVIPKKSEWKQNLPADNFVVLFEAVARLARLTAAATTDRKNMTVIDFELSLYLEIQRVQYSLNVKLYLEFRVYTIHSQNNKESGVRSQPHRIVYIVQ